MNTFVRLFFVVLSVIGLAIFTYGFTSLSKLSEGQSLMLWSLVPVSLMLFTASFYAEERANEVTFIMMMFVGIFFALAYFGMFKQSGEIAYGIFAWAGVSLCVTGATGLLFR